MLDTNSGASDWIAVCESSAQFASIRSEAKALAKVLLLAATDQARRYPALRRRPL
jgi:hypothetical protein